MKANELRIGNYVNIEGDVVKVKEIYEKSIHYANGEYEGYATEDFIQPIELTEEVLVRIWFKKIDNGIFRRKIGFYALIFNGVMLNIFDGVTGVLEIKCEYLHQLQNAYYCLTNEELEVKL